MLQSFGVFTWYLQGISYSLRERYSRDTLSYIICSLLRTILRMVSFVRTYLLTWYNVGCPLAPSATIHHTTACSAYVNINFQPLSHCDQSFTNYLRRHQWRNYYIYLPQGISRWANISNLGTDPKKGIFFSEWGKFKLGLPYDCGAKKRALGQMVGNSGYDTILPTIWVQRLGVVLTWKNLSFVYWDWSGGTITRVHRSCIFVRSTYVRRNVDWEKYQWKYYEFLHVVLDIFLR